MKQQPSVQGNQSTATALLDMDFRHASRSQWKPSAGVTDHRGDALQPDRDFFRPPTAQIGRILSAFSTLRVKQLPIPPIIRYVAIGACIAAGAICCLWGVAHGERMEGPVMIVGGIGGGGMLVLIAMYLKPTEHRCTYVGERGAVRYRLTGPLANRVIHDSIDFQQVAELRTGQIIRITYGLYDGTTYDFIWTSPTGERIYRLKGDYRAEEGLPESKNLYCFAHAAEAAFTTHLFPLAKAALERDGFLHFDIASAEWVRLAPGFLELCRSGEITRIEADEIKSCTLEDGEFQIMHRDVTWFSRKGKLSFCYGKMANARLFLLSIDRLLGLQS